MYFDVTTRASPDQVLRALTDFSDRRLRTWRRTLDPAVVRWTHEETSYGGHGTGEVRIAPTDDGGGRLHVEWSNTGATRRRDRAMLALVHNGPAHRLIARLWARALDEYARSARD